MVTSGGCNVALWAVPCWASARTPAARSGLWAMAARSARAELAPKRPDGMSAGGAGVATLQGVG
ncbi:hypothetical protein LAUMK35_02922 [Mycobacterium pseudokansasii]|uniref:Uncharacterized protein n=1 Tax=Mycobacterium pseudokansasii TaxID=2341080 RepID=A0A498QP69_9MYCO|nr:hypothetical protein LAUMK35_02922 [Mycobacterium pseudokansasii]VAZ96469.1 hypothetical protein LAUMK21_02922 [Mycobacterium pseudokansasii]VBA50796.1 hypothetical protein LAUMK142_02827 [Mycobacterium pseudokansasii]